MYSCGHYVFRLWHVNVCRCTQAKVIVEKLKKSRKKIVFRAKHYVYTTFEANLTYQQQKVIFLPSSSRVIPVKQFIQATTKIDIKTEKKKT